MAILRASLILCGSAAISLKTFYDDDLFDAEQEMLMTLDDEMRSTLRIIDSNPYNIHRALMDHNARTGKI